MSDTVAEPGRGPKARLVAGLLLLVVTIALTLISFEALRSGAPGDSGPRIDDYLAALEENPSDIAALRGISTLYERSHDLPAAVSYLKRLVAVDPTDLEAYLRLGTLELALGHNKAAQRALEDYRQLTTEIKTAGS